MHRISKEVVVIYVKDFEPGISRKRCLFFALDQPSSGGLNRAKIDVSNYIPPTIFIGACCRSSRPRKKVENKIIRLSGRFNYSREQCLWLLGRIGCAFLCHRVGQIDILPNIAEFRLCETEVPYVFELLPFRIFKIKLITPPRPVLCGRKKRPLRL
ncbi:DNA methylase N-4/N-6 domain protein (plasmid) [Blastomonas sp. RAC04]|nr:DNA methylase N-4/N-6 domain protein [Blastomonas sp. RAC04]